MADLRDNKPPAELVGDRLGGCFGECEMEIAMREIVRLAVERGTWRITLTESIFAAVNNPYAIDGFNSLIHHTWLVPVTGGYQIHQDVVKRLMRERPHLFHCAA